MHFSISGVKIMCFSDSLNLLWNLCFTFLGKYAQTIIVSFTEFTSEFEVEMNSDV